MLQTSLNARGMPRISGPNPAMPSRVPSRDGALRPYRAGTATPVFGTMNISKSILQSQTDTLILRPAASQKSAFFWFNHPCFATPRGVSVKTSCCQASLEVAGIATKIREENLMETGRLSNL